MLSVRNAEYLDAYRLRLTFDDGIAGVADLEDTLAQDSRPIFARLKALEHFRDFALDHGTVVWSNGLDMAPEYLFYLAFRNNPQLRDQFIRWGYSSPEEQQAAHENTPLPRISTPLPSLDSRLCGNDGITGATP